MARCEVVWNPDEPGPCIQVEITNSLQIIEASRGLGLESPPPVKIRALLDTGASVTVINRTFADHCKLFQTSEGSELRTIGGSVRCAEHAGSISFPGLPLRSFDPIRIVSGDFIKERSYACLIGRDILRYWRTTFDGPGRRILIED